MLSTKKKSSKYFFAKSFVKLKEHTTVVCNKHPSLKKEDVKAVGNTCVVSQHKNAKQLKCIVTSRKLEIMQLLQKQHDLSIKKVERHFVVVATHSSVVKHQQHVLLRKDITVTSDLVVMKLDALVENANCTIVNSN